MKRTRGFTLLEILVSLALVSLVMVAMNTFVFSMGELWGRDRGKRLFELHVRSVARYLEAELRTAALPPTGKAGTPAITLKEMRTDASPTEIVLAYDLPNGNRLMTWPGRALPDVACGLVVREHQGLVLLWHSRLETRFDEQTPREIVVTPLVTKLEYDYYDESFKRWQTEANAKRASDGTYTTPGRLRLTFTHDGRNEEIVLAVPAATDALPAF
jgi:prepilin-type N-terminal cleavage/methylation domain-containing protein